MSHVARLPITDAFLSRLGLNREVYPHIVTPHLRRQIVRHFAIQPFKLPATSVTTATPATLATSATPATTTIDSDSHNKFFKCMAQTTPFDMLVAAAGCHQRCLPYSDTLTKS